MHQHNPGLSRAALNMVLAKLLNDPRERQLKLLLGSLADKQESSPVLSILWRELASRPFTHPKNLAYPHSNMPLNPCSCSCCPFDTSNIKKFALSSPFQVLITPLNNCMTWLVLSKTSHSPDALWHISNMTKSWVCRLVLHVSICSWNCN